VSSYSGFDDRGMVDRSANDIREDEDRAAEDVWCLSFGKHSWR